MDSLPPDLALQCLLRVPLWCHPVLRSVNSTWNAALSNRSFHMERRRLGYIDDCLLTLTVEEGREERDERRSSLSCARGETGRGERASDVDLPEGRMKVRVGVGEQEQESGERREEWEKERRERRRAVCRLFDIRLRFWFELPLPKELSDRQLLASVAMDGRRLFIAGGEDGEGKSTGAVWSYDLSDRVWRSMEPMHCPRQRPISVQFQQFLYVLGLSSRERLCLQTMKWEAVEGADWPFLRGDENAPGVILDHALYVHKRYLDISVILPGQVEKWAKLEYLPPDEKLSLCALKQNLDLRRDKWLKVLSKARGEVVRMKEWLLSVQCEHFYCSVEVYSMEEGDWLPVTSRGEMGQVVKALKTRTPQITVIGNSIFLLGMEGAVVRGTIEMESMGRLICRWAVLSCDNCHGKQPWAFIGIVQI